MCVCVGASVYSFFLALSLLTTALDQSRRALVYVCVCKKGKKIGFALSFSQYRSLLFSLTHCYVSVCLVWLYVCDANGMKTAEIYSVALTFFFFLQQNSVISFLFFFSCRNRVEISNTNFLFTSNAHKPVTPAHSHIHF